MLALGQFFGRIGCLSTASVEGELLAVIGGFNFKARVFFKHSIDLMAAADTASAHVHPTQIYDSLIGLFLFIGLFWLSYRKTWDGQVFFVWLMLYPIGRSTVELFRGDDLERGFLFEWHSPWFNEVLGLPPEVPTFLSTSQFISLGMLLLGGLVWRVCRHRGLNTI